MNPRTQTREKGNSEKEKLQVNLIFGNIDEGLDRYKLQKKKKKKGVISSNKRAKEPKKKFILCLHF